MPSNSRPGANAKTAGTTSRADARANGFAISAIRSSIVEGVSFLQAMSAQIAFTCVSECLGGFSAMRITRFRVSSNLLKFCLAQFTSGEGLRTRDILDWLSSLILWAFSSRLQEN